MTLVTGLVLASLPLSPGAWPATGQEWVVRVDPSRASDLAAGPATVATLRAAFDAMRTIKAAHGGRRPEGARIELAPGYHFLDEPLVITSEDSGVIVLGTTNAPASIVSGGRRIEGWRAAEWRGRVAWVADVPDAKAGRWPFRELFVDGARRTRARHPDSGCLAVAAIADADAPKPWNEGVASFRFAAGDLDSLREDPAADVTVMCRWIESHVRVKSVDFDANVVTFREPTVFKLDPGDPYYLDGSHAFLDQPGEWWLDEVEGRLWYLPRPEEQLASVEIIAPRLDRLISIEGSTSGGPVVQDLRFDHVTFAHAGWWFAPSNGAEGSRASGFPQAAVGVPAALAWEGATDCALVACVVEHVGGWAVALGAGCRGNELIDCTLRDLGAGGVKIGETAIAKAEPRTTARNRIIRCDIGDGGHVFHSAVGVWIGQSPDNTLTASTIHDFLYTGISIGWTWGYGEADAGGNSITLNRVHHVGRRADGVGPWLSDMGGIYTLGGQPGTIVADNRFTDIAARTYGGWGIYFDEGSAGILAEGNTVLCTTHGGFHQHYGKDNVVARNVFAFGRDAQIQRTRGEPHTSFTFRNNVVLFERGELFAGDLSDGHFVFAENVYWRTDGRPFAFAGRTFEQWQAAGFDAGSKIADPGLDVSGEGNHGSPRRAW